MKGFNSFVINLERREDRRRLVEEEYPKIGIDPIFFPAYDEKPGWVGCTKSHLRLLTLMQYGDPFFVYEDDCIFLPEAASLFESAYRQLPQDWDMLYLGASPKEPQEKYSPNLYRLKHAHVTHAIMWHPRYGGALDYVLTHRQDIQKIDDYFANVIQPMFNCFVTYPMTATQFQSQSDTCKRSDVSTIQTFYNAFCP